MQRFCIEKIEKVISESFNYIQLNEDANVYTKCMTDL